MRKFAVWAGVTTLVFAVFTIATSTNGVAVAVAVSVLVAVALE